jgi:hypothetical protein
MHQVDLPEIRSIRIFLGMMPMLHFFTRMRVALHSQTGYQPDHRLVRLAESVITTTAYGRDHGTHLGFLVLIEITLA